MQYKKSDYLYLPVKDFVAHSPLLEQIGWSHRVVSALIRSKTCLDGRCDTNYGGWHTSKVALIRAIQKRNQFGIAPKVDIELAYRLISSEPLEPHKLPA